MQRTTSLAALLTAFALLGACGGDSETSTSTTTTTSAAASTSRAASSTTRPARTLEEALLRPADIPGSTVSASPPDDLDFGVCFPGNPLGGKAFAGEVESPDLELVQGGVQRQYSSSLRQGTDDQAADFITTFTGERGSQCIVSAFKSFVSDDPTPPRLDVSGLTGKVREVSLADEAAVLSVTGPLTGGDRPIPISFDMVAFRKGASVVLLSAGAVQGTVVPGQALELAEKVAGRLP